MPNGWLTISDVYNPLENAARAQQIRQGQQTEQMNQIAIQEAMLDAEKKRRYMETVAPGTGGMDIPPVFGGPQQPQVMPPQMPPEQPAAPMAQASGQPRAAGGTEGVPTPEQAQIKRGEHKIGVLTPVMTQAVSGKTLNAAAFNNAGKMINSDPDIQAAMRQQYEAVDVGADEKTLKAWQRFKKNWTREELDGIADKVPGGSVLRGMQPGNFWIEYDPVNKRIVPSIKTGDAEDSGMKMTTAQSVISQSLREKLKREPTATEILEEQQRLDLESYQQKYGGGASDDVWVFAARQYLVTGKMPPMGRSAYARTKIMTEAARIAQAEKIDVPELLTAQTQFGALKKSYEARRKSYDSDMKFAREVFKQIDELENNDLLRRVRKNTPRFMNQSLLKLKQLGATPSLGEESALALKINALINDYIKAIQGSSESIAVLPEGARQQYAQMINPQDPLYVTLKNLKAIRNDLSNRMQTARENLEAIESELGSTASRGKSEPGETEPGTKRLTFNPATGGFE